jgi:hypothetical protein
MTKIALVFVLVVGGLFAVLRWRNDAPVAAAENLVTNRIWIDHLPRHDRDLVQVFAMITRNPFGIFEVRSAWTGTFEAFRYEMHGDEVRTVFPQKGDRETIKVHARRCHDKGMDFCLDISGASRGVKHYYSREGWELPPNAAADSVHELAQSVVSANR